MSYDNLSSVSQNVLRFYQQLTAVERGGSLSFLMIFTFAVPELLDLWCNTTKEFSIAHPKYSNLGVFLTPDGNTSFGRFY